MWLARFLGALPKVLEKHPTARFVFLTLTQRNVDVGELRPALQAMSKAWDRLAKRKAFGAGVLGWIRTTEVTRGKDATAHPHFHVLLMVPSNYFTKNYVTQAAWVEMWRESLRVDYDPDVDVRTVKGDSHDGLQGAARETLKYSVKPSDMKADPVWFLAIHKQLRKLRFIASGGVLKDMLRPEEEQESDLLLLGDGEDPDPGPEVFFDWHRPDQRYKRS